MRIVQIGAFPLDTDLIRGGVEASVYGLALEQSKYSEVFVFDVPRLNIEDSIEEYDRLIVYRFHNPGPHQKDSTKRIEKIVAIISGLKPDICHIHGTGVFSWGLYKKLTRASIPLILTVHGLIGIEKKKALKEHFSLKLMYQFIIQSICERRLLSKQDTVFVDTEYVSKAIERYNLSRTPRMVIIPQGINEDFFHINCSDTSRTLLSVGSISKRKGHHLLIEAFCLAAKEMKDIKLEICGAITDKSYLQSLQMLSSTSGYQEQIAFFTDLPKEQLSDHFRNAHVFALHTQEESQGIVFAEAMATGLPVLSTSVGGVPYVVSDEENGYLTKYGDVKGFAQAIIKIMTSIEDWKVMSTKCKLTSQSYSWTAIAKKIEVEYQMII